VSEAKLWDDVRCGMNTRWHAQRHEDKYSTGIPDVSYGIKRLADGWIELKYTPALPTPGDGPWDFSMHHFTPEQRNWLEKRTKHGTGRVFLMARMGPVTAIWNWNRIRELLGRANFKTIMNASNAQWWHGPIDFEELTSVLANNRTIPPRFKL
jgi:hypothetical protein